MRFKCVLLASVVFPFCMAAFSIRASAQNDSVACTAPIIDASPGSTNDSVEGPVCLRVKFNALRYVGKLGENVTRDGAVDVSKLFPIPAAAVSGVVPPASGTKPTQMVRADVSSLGCGEDRYVDDPGDMEDAFRNFLIEKCAQRRLLDQDLAKVRTFEGQVSSLLDQINTTVQQVDERVASASSPAELQPLFAANGSVQQTKAVLARIIPTVIWPRFEDRLVFVRNLEDNVEAFRLAQFTVPSSPPSGTTYNFSDFSKTPTNLAAYTDLRSELQQLENDVRAVLVDASRYQNLQKKLGTLSYWQSNMTDTTPESFFITREVVSGTLFNFGKHKKIQLATQDRLPTLQQQAVAQAQITDLITVDFGNPFSLSGGVAFSSIGEREFGIVDSAGPPNTSTTPPTPTSVKKFGTTNHSSIHPLPIAIVHVRLHQWADGNYGFHGSFGIAGNLQPDAAGGSGADFLTGVSVSARRFAYLTIGWHIGRSSRLSGGFHEGDLVPAGITSPPLQKSYKSGLGIAITFTVPSK